MHDIARRFPLLADQAGVWDGEYVHVNAAHEIIDRHRSRLVCRLEDGRDGEAQLSQTNIYTWGDNQREIRYFVATLRGNQLRVSNELIDGWIGTVDHDATNRMILVGWTRPSEPGFRYYEMITVAEDGNAKNRTWHWYREGRLFQRTIINEERVSRDWQPYDDSSYYAYTPKGHP